MTAPLHAARPKVVARHRRPAPVARSAAGAVGLLQRAAGNRAVAGLVAQRKGTGAPTADPAMDALVLAGVDAFDTLGRWSLPVGHDGSLPPIPAGAPTGLRSALTHLQAAKASYFMLGPSAAEAVSARLLGKGAEGLAEMFLLGQQQIAQEKLDRARRGQGEWQAARTVLARSSAGMRSRPVPTAQEWNACARSSASSIAR